MSTNYESFPCIKCKIMEQCNIVYDHDSPPCRSQIKEQTAKMKVMYPTAIILKWLDKYGLAGKVNGGNITELAELLEL